MAIAGCSAFHLLRKVACDVGTFYKPWVPFSFFFVPTVVNLYGVYKFQHKQFFENKPNVDASRFGGPKSNAPSGGH